jgi:hypothetical protein
MSRVTLLTGMAVLCLAAPLAQSAAFVRGAYYRLGDADPGAAHNQTGNHPTIDSSADALHLSRIDGPRYSNDVPPLGPSPNKLSMAFNNVGPGASFIGFYGRNQPIPVTFTDNYVLETWVKSAGPQGSLPNQPALIAYNGEPFSSGFGFFQRGDQYVASYSIDGGPGPREQVLGPARTGEWHHLAFIHTAVGGFRNEYHYDGKLVASEVGAPDEPFGGFWLGGHPNPVIDPGTYLFSGWIDEVRFQTFNPLAAGAFDPTNFLIIPEPSAAAALLLLAFACRRRA